MRVTRSPEYRWAVLAMAVLATFGAIGFVTLFIGVGQALGPYLGGLLADASSFYSSPYLLSAGVFAVAVVAALFLPRKSG